MPTFETAEDRVHARRIAEAVGKVWGCSFVELKPFYQVDFMLHVGGDIVAVAEMKRRPRYTMDDFDKMGGVFVSLHKMLYAKHISEYLDLPFIFLIEDKAGEVYSYQTKKFKEGTLAIGGRYDRGLASDVEPVVCLKKCFFDRVI